MSAELNEEEIVFIVRVRDIQEDALVRLGRKLNDSELYYASKGAEAGFFDWPDIVGCAVKEAVELVKEEKIKKRK